MGENEVIRTMLIEDDSIIGSYMRSLFSKFSRLDLVACAQDGQEALEMIERFLPDLVFIDINIPLIDGMALAAMIREQYPDSSVVFTTAYSQYAAEAFKLEACDYLVKPITEQDIERVIKRHMKYKDAQNSAAAKMPGNQPERLIIQTSFNTSVIDPAQILYIERINRTTTIVTKSSKYRCNEKLDALEARLGKNFFRSHRGYIINLDRVEKIRPFNDTSQDVSFHGYFDRALVNRKKLQELIIRLGGKKH